MNVRRDTAAYSPVLVGITGGLGSGKTSVCRILAEMGCAVFEADKVAKDLQVEDPDVIAGLKRMFGENVYYKDASGKLALDRPSVALKVFQDPGVRKQVNELIHPKVFRAFQDAVDRATREGVKILVKEAAILLESGGDKGLDIVVVVTSDLEKRIERAMSKGVGSREEIMRRIDAQWPQEKLIKRADFVIENNGTIKELESRTRELYHKILCAAGSL